MFDPLSSHQSVAVFGLGASGIAAIQLLSAFHKSIIASDSADESKRPEFEAKLPAGTQIVLGHNDIGNATIIVTSPGLAPSTPIFAEAEARNVPVIAELELAARATDIPIVAISGTDGKTTTTTLTSHILNACGVTNKMGGNVGIPLCKVVHENPSLDCLVVETSAFQLVFCPTFHPHILIATNIAEDHSEYFKGDWNRYVETKRRPLANMHGGDIAILNASDPEIKTWNKYTDCVCAWYGASKADIPEAAESYACVDGDVIRFHHDGADHTIRLDALKLKGQHNLMNTMGAVMAALFMGCAFDKIAASIDSYELPPHRIQTICTTNGVRFIDDSKATNPHAGIAALIAVDEPTVLIVGGVDKGLSLTEWLHLMDKNVRHIMVIGALTERFCREADECGIKAPRHLCKTLEDAVREGYELARRDNCSVVMLSPGCSSYDMFKSYGQRGDVFAAAARNVELAK